jgi:hypothetical protein
LPKLIFSRFKILDFNFRSDSGRIKTQVIAINAIHFLALDLEKNLEIDFQKKTKFSLVLMRHQDLKNRF